MPAVSDAGPLIHLAQINRLNLLQSIFGKVRIVPSVKHEVVDEGSRLGHPDAGSVKKAIQTGHIVLFTPSSRLAKQASRLAKQERLSESDTQTFLVAKISSQPLLTDEKPLSLLGRIHGLELWNTWSIMLEGLRKGLLSKEDVQVAIKDLGEKRHKLSSKNAKVVLEAADRIDSSLGVHGIRPSDSTE